MRIRPGLMAAALAALLLAAACGGDGDSGTAGAPANQPAGARLVSPGKLTTCTNLPYPPFQFNEGGKVVGFDVDIIDLVAKRLGVTQEFVDIDFDAIKGGTALNGGRCDVAAAGMTITEERKQSLDFSAPYFDEYLAIMTKKGAGVKTLDDAKAKNLSLGVQAATTNLDHAKSVGFDPKQYKDSGKLLLALQSGQVDFVLQDLPVVNTWLKKPDLAAKYELAGQVNTGAQYGFAVKKGGNPVLLTTINDVLATAIKDGTWTSTYQKWMGSAPASTPKPSA
jgi:polar amino acid transport system substrate-binding protein